MPKNILKFERNYPFGCQIQVGWIKIGSFCMNNSPYLENDTKLLLLWILFANTSVKQITVQQSIKKVKVAHTRLPLIPVVGSQPAGDVSHKPGRRLPLLSARPAVTPTTLKRAATNFAAWWTEAQWVWAVSLRLLPDSVATAIWTQALLRLSPAR